MKLTKTSLAIAALFVCLGASTVGATETKTLPAANTAAVDPAVPEVLDTTDATDEDAEGADTNQEMNMAELEAEIRIACEEFAVDEKVAEAKVPEFVDACIAENSPIEESDAIETVDNGVPAIEEVVPEEAATTVPAQQATAQE